MELMPTRERLAQAIEKEDGPKWIIDKARQGYYDNYVSPLRFPINSLVEDLISVSMFKMAHRAMDGDFDGNKDEVAAWAENVNSRTVFDKRTSFPKKKELK